MNGPEDVRPKDEKPSPANLRDGANTQELPVPLRENKRNRSTSTNGKMRTVHSRPISWKRKCGCSPKQRITGMRSHFLRKFTAQSGTFQLDHVENAVRRMNRYPVNPTESIFLINLPGVARPLQPGLRITKPDVEGSSFFFTVDCSDKEFSSTSEFRLSGW